MIYIPILIIIIILVVDLYYSYDIRFNNVNLFSNNETEIETNEPWAKIVKGKKYNKYYVKINNIKRYIDLYIAWSDELVISSDKIDIDVDNDYLIIKVPDEESALVIGNLIVSNFMGDMTLEEIKEKNMVESSIVKIKKHKIIAVKLKDLIKENLYILNESETQINGPIEETNEMETIDTNYIDYETETFTEEKNSVVNHVEPEVKVDVPFDRYLPMFKVTPYEGSEFAPINF